MPDFTFIVRDGKNGIAHGSLLAINRKEALEALRERDILEIKEVGAKTDNDGGHSWLVFAVSFTLTLSLYLHALPRHQAHSPLAQAIESR